jgi:hypothetical protein
MPILWIGLGLIAAAIFVVIPHFSNEGCKDRWAPLEARWDFKAGCVVKIQGILYREENVSFGPKKSN